MAKAQPDPKKRAELYGKLEVLEREGMCPGEEADAIVGKGRWMTMQHYLHVGAAALQPVDTSTPRPRAPSQRWSTV